MNIAGVQRSAAIQRRQDEQPLPRLEEADMKQRLPLAITAGALIVSSLLCACTASPTVSARFFAFTGVTR